MRSTLDIALKDLRQKVRDRSAILIGVVAPFVLAALFSLMLGDIDQGFSADWVIVDLDGGEIARALDEGPISAMEAAGIVTVERLPDEAAARSAVDEGTASTAIVIPEGLSDAVASGSGATVGLVVNPDASISGQVAASVLAGFTSQVDAVRLSVATALVAAQQLPTDEVTAQLAAQAQALAAPIVIVDDAAADRQASLSTYYAAAMSILFVFLAAQFGVVSLLTEKRNGTLSRMLAAPVEPWSILGGKILVSMALAIVSMSIIVLGTSLLLGAMWGDPLAVAALIVAAALAATGIALLAVGFARTEDQAGSAVAIVTITLAVLGGSFFPVSQGPELMAKLSLLTPHAWFLRGVDDVSTGGDVVSAIGPIAVLLVIGLVTGGIGMRRARRVVVA